MNHEEIMAWGASLNYPYLTLSKSLRLRHGKAHYERLQHEPRRLRLAAKRIDLWKKLLVRHEVVQAISDVDKLLKTRSNVDNSAVEVQA